MDAGAPNVCEILRRCKDLPPAERFAAVGDFLFGTPEMLDLFWTHSSTQFGLEETVLQAMHVLRAAPFAPCFHVTHSTHVFLPFGLGAAVVFLDMGACPPPARAIFSLVVPLLCTREYSPRMRDSLVVPAGVDVAAWEPHRQVLAQHFAQRVSECSSDAAAVSKMLNIV